MIDEIVTLPRRVRPQPIPKLHPDGDCVACILSGLLEIPAETIYDRFHPCLETPDRLHVITALQVAASQGLVDRIVHDVPAWSVAPGLQFFGGLAYLQSLSFFRYARMAIDAGYYGIAFVDFERRGPIEGQPDHAVLVCGARRREVPVERGCGAAKIEHEILVSCSHPETRMIEKWVEIGDFLMRRGGFNAIWVRPCP